MIDRNIYRTYGYDILINTFEPYLRHLVIEILENNYGNYWQNGIPIGIKDHVSMEKDMDISSLDINEVFEELYLLDIKEIIKYNYKDIESLLGDLNIDKFTDLMDELNELRRKIAHAKSTFSYSDFLTIIENIKLICQNVKGREILNYLISESYKNAQEVPLAFFEEIEIPHNLPPEDYDLDGGFVGRKKELKKIKDFLYRGQDRIYTLIGAGGVGKTAVALKVCYSILEDLENPFGAILWFSAKTTKLMDDGIVPIEPQIKTNEELIKNILKLLEPTTLETIEKVKTPLDSIKSYIYDYFKLNSCLLVIDNLETIMGNQELIDFIKDIPRETKILITSRRGMGEIERRIELQDLQENDAIQLFRIIARVRNRSDLFKLSDKEIKDLVIQVHCYPLVIKWSIGQICLGKGLKEAFKEIFSSKSEIAEFSFNDIFSMLSNNAKLCLYSIIIYGDRPMPKQLCKEMTDLDEDSLENAMRELTLSSFVYIALYKEGEITYDAIFILSLTRGFIEHKLEENEPIRNQLQTKYYTLSQLIEDLQKSATTFAEKMKYRGVKTLNESIAYKHIKIAKQYDMKAKSSNSTNYEELMKLSALEYEEAIKIAPTFPYALIEYSKFEYYRKHIPESERLALKAVEVGKDNWHAWYNLGYIQRSLHQNDKAIESYKKAKELNPSYVPIFYELGRTYMYLGNFETAENELNFSNEIIKKSELPNYKWIITILNIKAENFRRWAEDFKNRGDLKPTIDYLQKSFETINEARKINSNDSSSISMYIRICHDLGLLYEDERQYEKAENFYRECIKDFGSYCFVKYNYISRVCNHLSRLLMTNKKEDSQVISQIINKGLSTCRNNDSLKMKLRQNLLILEGTRKYQHSINGEIVHIDIHKKFGIIHTPFEEYYFFFNGFKIKISESNINELIGKNVKFNLIDNLGVAGALLAVDIEPLEKDQNFYSPSQVKNPGVIRIVNQIEKTTTINFDQIIYKTKEILNTFSSDIDFKIQLSHNGINLSLISEAVFYLIENINLYRLGFSKFIEYLQFVCKNTDFCIVFSQKTNEAKLTLKKTKLYGFEVLPDVDYHSVERYRSILSTGIPYFRIPPIKDLIQISEVLVLNPPKKTKFNEIIDNLKKILEFRIERFAIQNTLRSYISANCFLKEPEKLPLVEQFLTLDSKFNTKELLLQTLVNNVRSKLGSFIQDINNDILKSIIPI